MPNVKISALPIAASLDGTEDAPIVQGGTTVKVALSLIAALFNGNLGVQDLITSANAQLGGSAFIGGHIEVGTPPVAAAGDIRMPNLGRIAMRNADNSADVVLSLLDNANNLFIGTDDATAQGCATLRLGSAGGISINAAASGGIYLDGSEINIYQPMVGINGPWGAVDGVGIQAMPNTNLTLASSIYSRGCWRFTGAITANRTVTIPLPANADQSYPFIVHNACTGAFGLIFSVGTGGTWLIANAKAAIFVATPTGIFRITPDTTP